MKALVLHGPGSYTYEENWAAPEQKPGWAIVEVAYCGVCGSDLPRFARTGSYHHPVILGHEFSGTVRTPAEGVSRFAIGDPVAVAPIIPCGTCGGCRKYGAFHCEKYEFIGSRNDGGMAEYCAVPESNLLRLPDTDSLRAGAFLEPIAVALHVVRKSGFVVGKTAAVYGSGTIGLLIAMWLRVFGASKIIILDLRDRSLDIAKKTGFDDAMHPNDWPAGETVDFAYEAAGSAKALQDAITHTQPCGVITVVGRDTKDTVIPREFFERMMRREITLQTCWGYELEGEAEFVMKEIGRGSFPVEHLVSAEVSLQEAPAAIAQMCAGEMEYCKVFVKP